MPVKIVKIYSKTVKGAEAKRGLSMPVAKLLFLQIILIFHSETNVTKTPNAQEVTNI